MSDLEASSPFRSSNIAKSAAREVEALGRPIDPEPGSASDVGVAMSDFLKLPARTGNGSVHAIVETPRGARPKLKYEPELGGFVLSKSLMLGLTYPYDWGFIPSTLADDGDPLDVMIIHEAATSPGLILRCHVIGALLAVQTRKGAKERNDRIIAVPSHSHLERSLDHARALPSETRDELEKFFVATDELEDKKLKFEGWVGPQHALRLLKESEKRFAKRLK
ncbi:MAG TPA: inorganic diphosphatase [Xanthobacteraceae bacterium]|nr:inorganic diphosphatase [Xanthobacteraceae bacterium]